MNAATSTAPPTHSHYAGTDDMRGSVITATLFHIFIFIVLTVGLPFMPQPPVEIAPPINVEVVDISDISRTNNPAPPQPKAKKVEEKKEEPKPAKPVPKQMTSDAPPDLTKPKPPDVKDLEKPKEEPKKIEALKKEELKKPDKPKEKPKPKEPPPKPKVEEKKLDEDFQSLLKNLTPDAPSAGADQQAKPTQAPPDIAQLAELADRLTVSEQDALRRQLSQCWNILAGAEYAENLAVELRVFMNPDRTVNNAVVLDRMRYNTDAPYRAAADAAMRALRNPNCSPLELPEGKFEQWKVFVIRFDPKDVL